MAVWGMQFIWPFRAEFQIIYLNEDYSQTVIGRAKATAKLGKNRVWNKKPFFYQTNHLETAKLKIETKAQRHTPQRISTTTIIMGQFLIVARLVKS